MTRAKIVKHWENDNLVRVPDSLLEMTNIPAVSKSFLSQIGMPKKFCFIDGGMEFEVLPLKSIPPKNFPVTAPFMLQRLVEPSAFLLSSSRYFPDYFFAIREKGAVEFASTSPDERMSPFTFINSDLPAWTECLLMYRSFIGSFAEDEEPGRAMVRGLERRLERIDPHAFDEDAYHWPVEVQEMRHYLGY